MEADHLMVKRKLEYLRRPIIRPIVRPIILAAGLQE